MNDKYVEQRQMHVVVDAPLKKNIKSVSRLWCNLSIAAEDAAAHVIIFLTDKIICSPFL